MQLVVFYLAFFRDIGEIMDFSKVRDTDDLLRDLPLSENVEWEFKTGKIILHMDHFRDELGKQVSGFANSGGGYLAIGIADKTLSIEPCDRFHKGESTKDWLSKLVSTCVEYSIRHFDIHEIPVAGDPSHAVFVIEIGDSPTAPHQSKTNQVYYWRIDGHTKPAHHFYLELLRNRLSSVILEIVDVKISSFNAPEIHEVELSHRLQPRRTRINFVLHIAVKNTSKQFAQTWGVRFNPIDNMSHWTIPSFGPVKMEGFLQYPPEQLLPGQTANLPMNLNTTVTTQGGSSTQHNYDIKRWFDSMQLKLMPISHNHQAEEVHLGSGGPGKWNAGLWESFVRELHKIAEARNDGTLNLLMGR